MRIRKTISLLLLVVYAFIFASTNFFYHSHQLANGTIVHSHIFCGCATHSHSAVQIQLIDQLNNTSYNGPETIQIQDALSIEVRKPAVFREESVLLNCPDLSFSLRAPPVA